MNMKNRFVFQGINLFTTLPLCAAIAATAIVAVAVAAISCTPKNESATRGSGASNETASSNEAATRGVSPAGDGSEPQKYAVVIGNGAYRNLTRLNNPVNDANDMKSALQGLGFNVDAVINGGRVQMEEAIERFKNRLSVSRNSYGFLFYAGHGVQSGGANYLIPVDADIRSESYLGERAVSVQAMLNEINQAGNELNIVVLDACRDNPFGWARSGSRGLQVVNNQPADSIIVYATSAGSTAADGDGRNGLFTSQLLTNLKNSALEVSEIFRLTGGAVTRVSGGNQRPAVYNQFYGVAYLGSRPSVQTAQQSPATSAPVAVTPAPTSASAPQSTPTPKPASAPSTPSSAPAQPAAQPATPAAAPVRNARSYSDSGDVFYSQGDYLTAIVEYIEAQKLDPNNVYVQKKCANAYMKTGNYLFAMLCYSTAIELEPNNASNYYNRGLAWYNDTGTDLALASEAYSLSLYDKAIADFTKAIRLDPQHTNAYYVRGLAYKEKGNYNQAIADYETALRIDPNYTNARKAIENAKKARGY
jgi:tetratricopeptide (TPR) repeat protein